MIDLTPAPATLPPGQRVYAVGDIHGCLDRLVALHEIIADDIISRPVERTVLVHLGDYVDRGSDSAQVIDWLIHDPPVRADEMVNLMGNHEYMMLSALAGVDRDAADHWLMNGGADSLLSWGIPRTVPRLNGPAGSPASIWCFSAIWRSIATSGRICSFMPASGPGCRWISSPATT